MLSAEELLAGSRLTFDVDVPGAVLRPEDPDGPDGTVRLRPLTVHDLQFLLHHVNQVSGIAASSDELARAAQAPLAKAAMALERAFGWTPAEVSELTVGQMLLHLQLLGEEAPTR